MWREFYGLAAEVSNTTSAFRRSIRTRRSTEPDESIGTRTGSFYHLAPFQRFGLDK